MNNVYVRKDINDKKEYWVYLSKPIVNRLKPYIETYTMSKYGIPYKLENILCQYEDGDMVCIGISSKSKLPLPLNEIIYPQYNPDFTMWNGKQFESKDIYYNIKKEIENEVKSKIMEYEMENNI